MKEGLKKITDFILDCVFPHSCFVCGASDTYFCSVCRRVEWFANPNGIFETQIDSPLNQVISLTRYTAGQSAAKLIEDFKYSFIDAAGVEINYWLKNTTWLSQKIGECDLIIPVPLHRRRLAERGYNQADTIARYLGTIINRPVNSSVLIRARPTKQQATLNRNERLKNVVDAFACVSKKNIINKKIFLIDDVYTTGSTMRECTRILRATGAESVCGFTLARG